MKPQIASVPSQSEVSNPFADLLGRDHVSSSLLVQPSTTLAIAEPARRFVAIGEVNGEVEVERTIDYGYTICARCFRRQCPCTDRIEERYVKTIRYAVEMQLATQIALQ